MTIGDASAILIIATGIIYFLWTAVLLWAMTSDKRTNRLITIIEKVKGRKGNQ